MLGELPLGYYLAAAALGVVLKCLHRRDSMCFAAAYAVFLLSASVLSRSAGEEVRAQLLPFWSYAAGFRGDRGLLYQIAANMLAFVPLGFALFFTFGKKGLWAGAGLSCLIELLQLVLRRGLFEFDDIFDNFLGLLIGYGLALLMRTALQKLRSKGENNDKTQ